MWLEYDENYSVSSEGEVYSKRYNRLLPGSLSKRGYIRITIYKKTLFLHNLVAVLFLPKIDTEGLMIDHINRDKTDNRACNLRWVTSSINNWNKGVHKNNHIGHKNIHFHLKKDRYYVRFGQKHYGSFTNLEEAIKKRDEVYNAIQY